MTPQQSQRVSEIRGLGKLAVTKGAEHEHPNHVLGPREVTEEGQASAVGPLEVIEHQHDRVVLGYVGQ